MSRLISIKNFYTAALITGCCFVYGCENDQQEIDVWTKKVTEVEEAKNIESYLSQEGVVKAKLTAPLMLRVLTDTGTFVEFPNALHVDFYNDSIKIETWLNSKYGKYYENQDKVYLRDSVIVINVKGDTLRAPELWWDQKAKLFYTDSIAEYHTLDRHIYGGKGLRASQDMTDVSFIHPTGVVKVSKEGTLE